MNHKAFMLFTSLFAINTLNPPVVWGNFTHVEGVEHCSCSRHGNNQDVMIQQEEANEEMEQEIQAQQSTRSALRGLIRTYLLPLYEEGMEMEGNNVRPEIITFLREARELFPLLPEDTSLEQAQLEVAQQWAYADFSDQALGYFLTLQKKKRGSRSHSQALTLLAGSYLAGSCLPPNYARAFRLFLHIGHLEEKEFLSNALDGLSILLRNQGEAVVGKTEKKKALAIKAATVLRETYKQLVDYPQDDYYY